jgi:hypothetical protein
MDHREGLLAMPVETRRRIRGDQIGQRAAAFRLVGCPACRTPAGSNHHGSRGDDKFAHSILSSS